MRWLLRSLVLLLALATTAAAAVPCVPAGGAPAPASRHESHADEGHAGGGHHGHEMAGADEDLPPCHRVDSLRAPCTCGCDGSPPVAAGSSASLGFGLKAAAPDPERPALPAVAIAAAPAASPATPSFGIDPVPI